jgi:hypothetical protein
MDSMPGKSAHGQSGSPPYIRGDGDSVRIAPCQVRKPKAGKLKPGLY